MDRTLVLLYSNSKTASWLHIVLPVGGYLVGVVAALWVDFPSTPVEAIHATFGRCLFGGGIGLVVGGFAWLELRARMLPPYLRKTIEDYEKTGIASDVSPYAGL